MYGTLYLVITYYIDLQLCFGESIYSNKKYILSKFESQFGNQYLIFKRHNLYNQNQTYLRT